MKVIVLDFDGTLGDTRSVIVRTMQDTIAEMRLPARSDAECAATIGLPLAGGFAQLFPDATPEVASRGADIYRRIFAANMADAEVPLFPHVTETLRQLRARGYVLTIASSRSRGSLMHFVRDMHLDDVITLVLGADDVERHKPDPEPVLLTLRQLAGDGRDAASGETGCHAGASSSLVSRFQQVWVVGDMTFDIQMGRRAGAHTIGVTYGNGTHSELQQAGADYIVDDFQSLLHIMDSTSLDDDASSPLAEGQFVRSH